MILTSQLDTLLASGLVQLAAAQPELEYIFRHALIQDAAYHSLVKADRRQLHRAVGEALEALYWEPAASPDQLPHIFLNLGQALELDARYAEAAARYVEMEARARERGDRGMQFAALLARAKILSTPNPVYDPGQARALLEQALRMARALGDRAAESKILWNLMVLDIFDGGDLQQAITYGEQSLGLARELDLRE